MHGTAQAADWTHADTERRETPHDRRLQRNGGTAIASDSGSGRGAGMALRVLPVPGRAALGSRVPARRSQSEMACRATLVER